jgi:hypothetical protein
MKKLTLLLMCAFALCAFGCSAGDEGPDEQLGEIEQEFGTCTWPRGGHGTTNYPPTQYVSHVGVSAAAPYRIIVGAEEVSTGVETFGLVDFGNGRAIISGGGWTAAPGVKLRGFTYTKPNTGSCQYGSNLWCMKLHGTDGSVGLLKFDKNYAHTVFEGSYYCDGGFTRIAGIGLTKPQYMRWYCKGPTGIITHDSPFEGPALDACL